MHKVRCIRRWVDRLAWLALCLSFQTYAAALDLSASKLVVSHGSVWCVTDPAMTFEQVRDDGCAPVSMQSKDLSQGFDRRAYWARMVLRNPGHTPIERWLFVGHPRLEMVSLFSPKHAEPGGAIHEHWLRQDLGLRVPMIDRDDTGRSYGVFSVSLPAGSERTVWLRVSSRTAIDLTPSFWSPAEFRQVWLRTQFSTHLALGVLFAVMVFAVMIYSLTRELSFLFFGLFMFGELLFEGVRSGVLHRYLMPADWPAPVQLLALGSMLATIGFTVFFHSFVPTIRRQGALYLAFMALVVISLLGYSWSILIDYRAGAQFWTVSVNALILVGIALALMAWRRGIASAGTLILSFAGVAVLELVRLFSALGGMSLAWGELTAGPWVLVLITPLVLLSLMQRFRETQATLTKVQQEHDAKIQFLAKMSHELRSPLNTILGNAQLLSRQADQQAGAAELQEIQNSGRNLLGMIDELLEYSRGVAGRLQLEPLPVNWPQFLISLESNARRIALGNGNGFAMTQTGHQVQALMLDERYLRQILDNLLENAGRYTRQGTILLHVHAEIQANGTVDLSFALSDSGIGIHPEDLERIFLPFERGQDVSRRYSMGMGMGLSIAKQLTEKMGGRIQVESSPGNGSRFTFNVSCLLADEMPVRRIQHQMKRYRGSPRTILLVEDDEQAAWILQKVLAEHGFFFKTVHSGHEAIAYMRQQGSFDLVLVDQLMAHGDGWDVLREIHATRPGVPTILMSSCPPVPSENPHGEGLYARFLLKPIEHDGLLQEIGQLLALEWEQTLPIDALPVQQNIPPETPIEGQALIELRQMIELGAVSAIMEWAELLKAEQPENAVFFDQVKNAVVRLDFEKLQQMATMSSTGASASLDADGHASLHSQRDSV